MLPKLATGTMYENGFVIRVTRAYLPSGDMSTAVIIPGFPNFVTAPVATSMIAICPVAWYSRSCWSYGVFIRLGYVRRRFRSASIEIDSSGPAGTAGGAGRAVRPSGPTTATIDLPLLMRSKVVTNVVSSDVFEIWRGLFVATSVTHR